MSKIKTENSALQTVDGYTEKTPSQSCMALSILYCLYLFSQSSHKVILDSHFHPKIGLQTLLVSGSGTGCLAQLPDKINWKNKKQQSRIESTETG